MFCCAFNVKSKYRYFDFILLLKVCYFSLKILLGLKLLKPDRFKLKKRGCYTQPLHGNTNYIFFWVATEFSFGCGISFRMNLPVLV